MPKSIFDEDKIVALLNTKGLEPLRYTEDERNSLGQTPDFRVLKNGNLAFYCEVKSHDEIKGDYQGPDPTYNTMTRYIHKAVKQFKSVNKKHDMPNVLAIVNNDIATDFRDLKYVFNGYAKTDKGNLHIFNKYSSGRIKEEKYKIDLFIWLQHKSDPTLHFVISSPFFCQLCLLFGVDPDEVKGRK